MLELFVKTHNCTSFKWAHSRGTFPFLWRINTLFSVRERRASRPLQIMKFIPSLHIIRYNNLHNSLQSKRCDTATELVISYLVSRRNLQSFIQVKQKINCSNSEFVVYARRQKGVLHLYLTMASGAKHPF